ncbi:hypothetical protein G2912_28310 [Paraburkholderia aspalathi]|uniref:ATP-binding protein n=1 Tax=Paraburkholderia nemoris TaxID=2793076 RepID=A0ABN7MQD7_9BURK|nr:MULTISPECIES: hypothetical protein [Paraburkholderia]MBK3814263.1 hypothetical protein [Paraburkholderia aspalathi]CAE6816091.1 hypothetical protein R69776_05917 [Paraburkholderia nemoris]
MTHSLEDSTAKRLSKVLGLYKAEWLNGTLFSLFNEPAYFEQLKTQRPCVLIGGRGTGKTTVLRGLSYQGQLALEGAQPVKDWPYYGLYYRVNTNRVTAFRGGGLNEDKWSSYFGHYVNLSFCQLLLEFATWYEAQTGETIQIADREFRKIAATLSIDKISSISELSEEIELLILEFEASVNTISDDPPAKISALGAPLDAVAEALAGSAQLSRKQFFFLIDEFENFEDYQQRVLNTIIKHANTNYTFKIGVRELGWRQRATLNHHEQLTSPADYARINIAEWLNDERFPSFAAAVIKNRLLSAYEGANIAMEPQQLLPAVSELQEAELLLDKDAASNLLDKLKGRISKSEFEEASKIRPGHLYFLAYMAEEAPGKGFVENVQSWLRDSRSWQSKLDNYFYASLFSIRRGKRGIRKYYCGWDVFVSLANGNIRYLLELVHAAFLRHIENEGDPGQSISARSQTEAAADVGRKNLSELEGLSVDGGKLTKLVLGLGRVLQVMAANPEGHAPEVTQFHVTQATTALSFDDVVRRYLDQAVMHLALVRSPGNKLMSESDTQEYDYRLHPIFAPLFVFSHRKKRKFAIAGPQLLGLVERPRETIRDILAQSDRNDQEALPDQLQLFGTFYASN